MSRMKRIIVPVGRGRIGKTSIAAMLAEMLLDGDHPVTTWDLDKAPSLKRRISDAQRPFSGGDRARRAALEDCLQVTITGEADAVVDMGADDVLFHMVADKLPEMTELLAEAGVEVVAIHVLGPDADKDLAYYRATKDGDVFGRQIVVLNHGMVAADDISADKAFATVRGIVNASGLPVYVTRRLPVEVMQELWPEDVKAMRTLHSLTDEDSPLLWTNRMVLKSYLNKSIRPIINAVLNDTATETEEAAE